MEFSTPMTQRASRGMVPSPYPGRQSGLSPARSSDGYHSFQGSPASGHAHHHHQHRHLHPRGDEEQQLERRVQGAMSSSPQGKGSPKRQFSPFISCMFASSPASSSSSPAPSSPLLSSSSSVSSSPYYHYQHQHHHHHHHQHLNSAAKRQMLLKENDPRSTSVFSRSPSSSHPALAVSPQKTLPSTHHCKRRLDFNHNPVSDHELDLNLNLSFAAAAAAGATHTIDELALSFSPDLVSPGSLPQSPGDAAALGRVPAVAVARRNERERNRVKLINMTFATLREHLPHSGGKSGKSRKMSKVETLRAAIEYIRQLHSLTKEKQQQQHQEKSSSGQSSNDENIHSTFDTVLKVKALDMEADPGCPPMSGSSVALSSASSLALSSPLSSAGGARSPVSDDGCSTYDHFSTEEEDLLEFASNWF